MGYVRNKKKIGKGYRYELSIDNNCVFYEEWWRVVRAARLQRGRQCGGATGAGCAGRGVPRRRDAARLSVETRGPPALAARANARPPRAL
ncbi:unnamed protein product [Pieris macdunnoughi]|uniref:Uncharacterized protein n=1 Tax=Pieris macdunnoughi TaxID=345717 RepID=A0A821LZF8_9NEOP|nr:unnamed protein product [Pieris macdunnoughi]